MAQYLNPQSVTSFALTMQQSNSRAIEEAVAGAYVVYYFGTWLHGNFWVEVSLQVPVTTVMVFWQQRPSPVPSQSVTSLRLRLPKYLREQEYRNCCRRCAAQSTAKCKL